MQTSESIKAIMPALLKAQKEIKAAIKLAENPYFGSHYADLTTVLDAIKGPLNDNGIVLLQGLDYWSGSDQVAPYVETRLVHAESGEWVLTRTPIVCAKAGDPQAFGSGSTYGKRYALQALIALPTEDDDAEKAQGRKQEQEPKMARKPNINLKLLRSDKGLEYLRQAPDAQTAIAKLSETKNISAAAKKAIEAIFADFQADPDEANDNPSDETAQP